MRNFNSRLPRAAVPVYCYETDLSIERVIRDPMAVLLGRSSLSLQADMAQTDPYNRVGRWARAGRSA